MSIVPNAEVRQLIRDKYGSVDQARESGIEEDLERLAAGEPLAYVIGWAPFLGLRIDLASRPLIPRPETEWWTAELISTLRERFGEKPLRLLDLCAGSGAIGLAVLAKLPQAAISFGESEEAHADLIRTNLALNCLDGALTDVRQGDLFAPFPGERFDVIATNPPYVPSGRALEPSVADYEPAAALYAGADGLDIIRRIAKEAPDHLAPGGELWLECDTSNIEKARGLVEEGGAKRAEIRTDQYGRSRLVVGYYA
jgi:release factor glutamine methyltransferase